MQPKLLVASIFVVVLLAACAPNSTYERSGERIQGKTLSAKTVSIAQYVTQTYSRQSIAVASGSLETSGNKRFVQYVLEVYLPADKYYDTQSQEAATTGAALAHALADLLRLSTTNLLSQDPTLTQIEIKIVLPAGDGLLIDIPAERLQAITPPDAEAKVWLGAIAGSMKQTIMIDAELWQRVVDIFQRNGIDINNPDASSPAPSQKP